MPSPIAMPVKLTRGAERDLAEINECIALGDSPRRADALLGRIGRTLLGLARSPQRGSYPRELLALGIRDYRQVVFKPHRIIYRVTSTGVFVVVVADGRRDMEALVSRRLLQP